MLRLDSINQMYYEESGNPHGIPVVFLHGGPGAGSNPAHRQFFDPAFYRIVVFDQRGAGKSTPRGSLHENTTAHLVDDIETLRAHLEIARWVAFGGSWGSTLAIAYAQRHPLRCLALVLRGIFLGRRHEIDWFLHGMRNFFPEAWRAFTHFLPEAQRGDPLEGYWRLLADPDPALHLPAARAWSAYEGACSTLLPSRELVASFAEENVALGLARIEAHYFRHDMFLAENPLLENIAAVRGVPAVIVQGRYDSICPIVTADELHHAWPEAQYIIVDDAGHSAFEPGIRSALVETMETFKSHLRA